MNNQLLGQKSGNVEPIEHFMNDINSCLGKNFITYINGVEIKNTTYGGRGVFASKDIKKGEFLVAEKAIATGHQNPSEPFKILPDNR